MQSPTYMAIVKDMDDDWEKKREMQDVVIEALRLASVIP